MRRAISTWAALLVMTALLSVSCQETSQVEKPVVNNAASEAKWVQSALDVLSSHPACEEYVFITRGIHDWAGEIDHGASGDTRSVASFGATFKRWLNRMLVISSMISQAYLPQDVHCRMALLEGDQPEDAVLTFELGAYLVGRLYHSQIHYSLDARKLGLDEEVSIISSLISTSRELLLIMLTTCENELGDHTCNRLRDTTMAELRLTGYRY